MTNPRIYVTDLVSSDTGAMVRASSIPMPEGGTDDVLAILRNRVDVELREVSRAELDIPEEAPRSLASERGASSGRSAPRWSPDFLVEALREPLGSEAEELVQELFDSGRIGFEASQARMRRLVTVGIGSALVTGGASPIILLFFATGVVVVEAFSPVLAGIRGGVEEGLRRATADHVEDVADGIFRKLRGLDEDDGADDEADAGPGAGD